MNLTKPPIDSPHTSERFPVLILESLYWIAVTALLAARVMFFGFTFFEKFELQSPWFIPVIVLHSLYIIALPIAAYAKSAVMIRFALYAFAGSMIMPVLFSVEHFLAFIAGGWPNLPPIMLILSAPLVLLYNNSAIIHKHRQAFQNTFRLVAIITLLSIGVYFLVAVIPNPFFFNRAFFFSVDSTLSTFEVTSSISSIVLFSFLFGGIGHIPMLAMVIVWRYLDTNRFNSILRTLTTTATIAVLGWLFLSGVLVTFGGTDLLARVGIFFLLTLPGFISIFFMARVALRSITTVHPFISPFGYPIFKVLGPKPMPRDPNKPTLGAKILADYRDKSLFHLDENEEPQKS